jgi:hypothetical protein
MSHHLEQLAGHVAGATDALRRKTDLAGVGVGEREKLRDGLGGDLWIDQHKRKREDEARDRRDVTDEIEAETFVHRGIGRGRRRKHQQRVAVRRRSHDRFGADIGVCARAVFSGPKATEPMSWLPGLIFASR